MCVSLTSARSGDVLPNLLATEGAELGSAGAHDIVRGRNVGLVPVKQFRVSQSVRMLEEDTMESRDGETDSVASFILDWKT